MSNPNWKTRTGGQGGGLNKQLEEYEFEDAMTREQYMRGRGEPEPERREPRKQRGAGPK